MPLRTLLVGYGWWGQVLESALLDESGIGLELVGIVALDKAGRSQSGIGFHRDYDKALKELKPEAVLLATPHSLHANQIETAANAGCHVFCEKPLALSREEAERAIAACQRAGVVLGVGFQRRCWPSFEALRALVSSGKLGDLRLIEGNYSNNTDVAAVSGKWRDNRTETPGPIGLTGMSIHPLDQMVGLAGRLLTASPVLGSASSVGLRFRSGVIASLTWMQGTPEFYRLAVFGTRGWAELTGPEQGRWKDERGEESPLVNDSTQENYVSKNLRQFASAAISGGPWPTSAEALEGTVEAFERVVAACMLAAEGVEGGGDHV